MVSRPTPQTRAEDDGLVCALTFDDGPGPATEAMLDVLAEYAIRATFCVVGERLDHTGAAVLRRIRADGHLIANHTMSYADLGDAPAVDVERDLIATNDAIRRALGDPAAPIEWFRAPNGNWGRTAEVAVRLGMRPLGVTNTIDDWLTQDVPRLTANLRRAIRPGELVVAHDGGGDRRGTVEAFARVIPEYRAAGWRFTLPRSDRPRSD